MIEKIKKMIAEAVETQYELGFSAGYDARKLEEKEQNDRNLLDLYRRGYKQGYEEAKAEIGEITLDDLKEV